MLDYSLSAPRVFFNRSGSSLTLSPRDESFLVSCAESYLIEAEKSLGAASASDHLLITVSEPNGVVKDGDIGGETFARNKSKRDGKAIFPISIDLCLSKPGHLRSDSIQARLRGAIRHERHHAERDDLLEAGCDATLGELVLTEGLAICFQIEKTGREIIIDIPHCLSSALKHPSFPSYMKSMPSLFDEPLRTDCLDPRFFGEEGNVFYPPNCGYCYGFLVCSGWLKSFGLKASEQAGADPLAIWKWWRSGSLEPFQRPLSNRLTPPSSPLAKGP